MKNLMLACLVLFFVASLHAVEPAAPAPAIRALLADFLTNNSDPKRHDNFWADDLVYTSALGVVRGKPEVMKSVREAASSVAPAPAVGGRGTPVYTAEDIAIRPYEGFAALNFRLVARYPDGSTDTYRNSGTLVLRDQRWQVVTWQATKVPAAEKK